MLEDNKKVPNEAVTSNLPKDPKNPPSDVKEDKGYKVPEKTPEGKSPEITIDVSRVSASDCVALVFRRTNLIKHDIPGIMILFGRS